MNITGLKNSLTKFENHSALRQKMFGIAGVRFGKGRIPQIVQEKIRSAMILCLQCDEEQSCKVWIETAEKGSPPPDFCQLRMAIMQIKALAENDKA